MKYFRSITQNSIIWARGYTCTLGILLLSACGQETTTAPALTADADVRMIWYNSTVVNGDPATQEGLHEVKMATATDGVRFTNAAKIFEANHLVDPDFFSIPSASGGGFGLLYTIHSTTSGTPVLGFATSATIDGTYIYQNTLAELGGQSSTLTVGGQLKTFVTGVSSADISITSGSAAQSNKTFVIDATTLGLTSGSGVVGDPSVIQLSDGSYMAFVKYAPMGAQGPSEHDLYTVTSQDLTAWGSPRLLRESASVPGAVRVGNEILVYFVDFSGELSSSRSLGMGLSRDNGATFEFGPVLLDGEEITQAYDPAALPLQ
jgi:hypothetical protein